MHGKLSLYIVQYSRRKNVNRQSIQNINKAKLKRFVVSPSNSIHISFLLKILIMHHSIRKSVYQNTKVTIVNTLFTPLSLVATNNLGYTM